MSLWKSQDAASNAPVYTVASGYGISANGFTLYENADLAQYNATGVYGVDATEANITGGDGNKVAHAGWVLRRAGQGSVTGITANARAVGTNSFVTFTGGGTGNTSANARIAVNTAGYITSVTLNYGGVYTATPTAAPASGNAVFTLTMGGRIGRTSYETLVAMGSMTGDGDDTYFPDT